MNTRFLRILFGILIVLSSTGNFVVAQKESFDFNSIDFQNVNIDEISDDQIRAIIERMEENGISPQQLEMAAIARGMAQADVQKLLLRMNRVRSLGATKSSGTTSIRTRSSLSDEKTPKLKPESILSLLATEADSMRISEDPRKRIFGFSLFNSTNLTFEPSLNIPTPAGYILGPGDEVLIDVWGASQNNYNLMISPEGYIFPDKIGAMFLSGLTIEEATIRIRNRFSAIYAGLRGSVPNTFMQVSLGDLRSIKVILLGESHLPGTYTVNSMASALNALYLSGGPNMNGSMRSIKLIRGNRTIDTLDVYDILFKGTIGEYVHLCDQDIIRIDPYAIRVVTSGEVKRPMIYEMNPAESLEDLIVFSGGFTEKAYTRRLKVYRNTASEKKIIDIPQDSFKDFAMQNGDSVVVEKILERFENRVEIKGAVYRPGFYSIGDSLTLLQLLSKAEGLKGDAFLSRVVIFRTMENYNLESISVDLEALQKGIISDPVLKREDIVVVPSVFDLQEEFFVQIDGEVRRPGKYPFMFNSNVEDVIIQAGGLLESASMARLEVARRVKDADATTTSNKVADIFYFQISKELRLTEEGKNLKLEPFDRIFVRRSPGYEEQLTVTIEGEVTFPGQYSISNKDERISDVIRRAGGLTTDAYPNGASLLRVFQSDEKERKMALESTNILRQEYWTGLNTVNASLNLTNSSAMASTNTEKMRILDSLLMSSVNYRKEQAIGIDLVKIMSEPHSKHDLIVQEGDVLKIPKLLQTVSLNGALLHPITVRYDKRYNFRNYISSAGGFAQDARRSKAYVIYANGSVDITRSYLGIKKYPKPGPGAEIIVPVRDIKRRLTPGEVLSLSSAVTSMALIMVTLINNL